MTRFDLSPSPRWRRRRRRPRGRTFFIGQGARGRARGCSFLAYSEGCFERARERVSRGAWLVDSARKKSGFADLWLDSCMPAANLEFQKVFGYTRIVGHVRPLVTCLSSTRFLNPWRLRSGICKHRHTISFAHESFYISSCLTCV